MFSRKKKEQPNKDDSNYIYFESDLAFPATAGKSLYTLAAYRISDRTRYLLPSKSENQCIIAAALSAERRIERRSLIEELFYGTPTHGVSFTAAFKFPARSTTIFAYGLRLATPGYDSNAIARGICKFLQWQAGELKIDRLLFQGELSIPEADLLRSNHAIVRIFWLSAIASKYASIVGSR